MTFSIGSIVHPTDFSDLGAAALAHALRIALTARRTLSLLHVEQLGDGRALAFPDIRRLVVQWGLAKKDDPPWEFWTNLGVEVANVRLDWQEPTQGIFSYLNEHTCDLLVLATHGRAGTEHLLKGSVAEAVSRRLSIPALFLARDVRGFVDPFSGDMKVRSVLVPVDHVPPPRQAIDRIVQFGRLLAGAEITVHLLHVGPLAPSLSARISDTQLLPSVMLRSGDIVATIIDVARELEVDFIGMPTAGRTGVLDALRGSTTERVIRSAPCPVFAVPAREP